MHVKFAFIWHPYSKTKNLEYFRKNTVFCNFSVFATFVNMFSEFISWRLYFDSTEIVIYFEFHCIKYEIILSLSQIIADNIIADNIIDSDNDNDNIIVIDEAMTMISSLSLSSSDTFIVNNLGSDLSNELLILTILQPYHKFQVRKFHFHTLFEAGCWIPLRK